ncbi:hypothetical protein KV097_16510 [Mumia sp. zg.B17]|uniref:hypothetical protein n=1 Tax=Mumia sp. zg.B17 TaxID=2855446 RepID=UPI001C6E821E|nr:hypothetical protein [Mumia sp. zg.B17]MBW9207542.1 hypothetical protein [Mumia sp. zg.B17]
MLRAVRTAALMLATTNAVVAGTLAAAPAPAGAASPYVVTSAADHADHADHADATPGDGQRRASAAAALPAPCAAARANSAPGTATTSPSALPRWRCSRCTSAARSR